MFNPFGQVGELKKLRDQAKSIQNELQSIEIAIDKKGVHVVATADQRIKELITNGKSDNDIKEAINEAMKKSQEAAAKKMQEMGGLGGLGSMLGGGN